MTYEIAGKRIFVAGHRGLVGSAVQRRLGRENCEIITADRSMLDLRDAAAVERFLRDRRPHVVIMAAAKVGGIHANNTNPVEFLTDNLAIAQSTISSSFNIHVEKFLFLGSSCVYPRLAVQPIKEESLLSGPLEPTNEWYAVAKIAGIKMCQAYRRQYGADFVSLMPTNLYGPGDNYHPEHSHVPAALIRRFHEAKAARASSVAVWGTGTPKREFLFVDDLADACIFVLKYAPNADVLNVGTGYDITIADFAEQVREVVGFEGQIDFDASRPDGTPRKLLDVTRLNALGWRAQTSLSAGLAASYEWFLRNIHQLRAV
jgi:GDP-L-fucose synthase